MNMPEHELYALIADLNNGVISPEQHARLDAVLLADPAARQLYYDYADVHLQLHRRFASHDPIAPLTSLDPGASKVSSPSWFAKASRSSTWTHLLAIAATVLCVLVLQHFNGNNISLPTSMVIADNIDSQSPGTYIATLVKSANCIWEGEHRPKFDGQRLLTNELQLKEGIAEFRFDEGVRIVMEGPASLTIESATSALLTEGKVVLHGSEMGDPFALHTPVTTLLDIGTEYGAEVDSQGATEVFVFNGEVSVVPRGEALEGLEPKQLTIGQANRFEIDGVKPVKFASEQFKREVPEVDLPTMQRKEALLAYDGFDYATSQLGNANGGIGWAGPWRDWYGKQDPSLTELQSENTLGNGPCLRVFGKNNVSWRTLEAPIRLDEDGVYYLSFLFRKVSNLPRSKSQYGAIEFRTTDFPIDDSKLAFGVSSEDYLHLSHNKQQQQSAPPIPFDETVLIVAKIVAGKSVPDQVMVRWYGAGEKVDSTEPHIWSCVLRPENGDAVFDKIAIRVGGDVTFLVDEIRLGTSWEAVSESSVTAL